MKSRVKPKVALLRGPWLSPYEMQSYVPLRKRFDLTVITPHKTRFDLTDLMIPRESLWCPLEERLPLQNPIRNALALKESMTGQTGSYCGMADRLKGFDILHVMDQYFCFGWEAVSAKRKYGSKIVVTQWENIPHLNEGRYLQRRTKAVIRKDGDLFIAMSDGAREVLMAEGVDEGRIRRASGAVDVSRFRPGDPNRKLAAALGIPREAWTVMYAGRVNRDKGVFTLLEAFEKLASRDKNAHLLLVGKDESEVAAYVRARGLSEIVHLAGFVPYERMPDYYRLSRVFVLPSLPTKGWVEQFGYVIAEAFACGVPVIGSDTGAIPEVVGDSSRIFPAGDSHALAGKLLSLSKKHKAVLSRAARKRALKWFSSDKLARDLGRFYDEVLDT